MLTLILLLLSPASCFSASVKGEWMCLDRFDGMFGTEKEAGGVSCFSDSGKFENE